jgi:hypothetical protein
LLVSVTCGGCKGWKWGICDDSLLALREDVGSMRGAMSITGHQEEEEVEVLKEEARRCIWRQNGGCECFPGWFDPLTRVKGMLGAGLTAALDRRLTPPVALPVAEPRRHSARPRCATVLCPITISGDPSTPL